MLAPWKKSYEQPKQHIKKQRHYFTNKGLSSQSYGFSSSHVWMWELDYKESWVLKNWCFWTVVLEKTLESPLDSKEIQPVHPKGNQSWISLEGLMLKLKLECSGHLMQRTDSLERPWRWEGLKAGIEGDDRGQGGWTQRTWVWVGFGSWWWTGEPGVLQSMGLQRVRHNWVTELALNWLIFSSLHFKKSVFPLFFNFWLHPKECGILVSWPGIKPMTFTLEGGVLSTGASGKSFLLFYSAISIVPIII